MERLRCASLPLGLRTGARLPIGAMHWLASTDGSISWCALHADVEVVCVVLCLLLLASCWHTKAKFLPEQSPYETNLPAPGTPPPELDKDEDR